MAEFLVKMADERGRVMQQVETARTAAEIRERFALQGFLVYDVQPRGILSGGDIRRRRKVRIDDFVVFNQQFLTLIKAGLPILTALELLGKQQKNDFFRGVIDDVRRRVKAGESLSGAFEAQNIANKIYTTTLLAGERSGNLEEVLQRYITFQRLAITFRKKFLASLIYPALLITAMFVLLGVLILYVVPQFGKLYSELGSELPAMTRFMLALGENAQQYALFVVPALVIAGFLVLRWKQTEAGAAAFDRIRLSLPLLGSVWLKYQIAMFSRMMSTLLQGGLPLVSSLETAGASIQSRAIANAVVAAGGRVREGRSLAQSLQETRVMPELAIGMIEVGESTGALPQMLSSVAEFYEEDVETALAASLSLIEPFILIIMGLVVAVVLISLYLPIFNLAAAAGAR
jgi:type IV pilus assembly protein PilC